MSQNETERRVFVYGTLMRGFRLNPILDNAVYLGSARLDGARLISLGKYPGMLPGEPDESVVGEVYALPAEIASKIISALDAVESEGRMYARRKVYPKMASLVPSEYRWQQQRAVEVAAEAYWYLLNPNGYERVPNGDWHAYAKRA